MSYTPVVIYGAIDIRLPAKCECRITWRKYCDDAHDANDLTQAPEPHVPPVDCFTAASLPPHVELAPFQSSAKRVG